MKKMSFQRNANNITKFSFFITSDTLSRISLYSIAVYYNQTTYIIIFSNPTYVTASRGYTVGNISSFDFICSFYCFVVVNLHAKCTETAVWQSGRAGNG